MMLETSFDCDYSCGYNDYLFYVTPDLGVDYFS